jgi:hypothetical protein
MMIAEHSLEEEVTWGQHFVSLIPLFPCLTLCFLSHCCTLVSTFLDTLYILPISQEGKSTVKRRRRFGERNV